MPARLDSRELRIGQCKRMVVDGVEIEVCKVEQGVLEVRVRSPAASSEASTP